MRAAAVELAVDELTASRFDTRFSRSNVLLAVLVDNAVILSFRPENVIACVSDVVLARALTSADKVLSLLPKHVELFEQTSPKRLRFPFSSTLKIESPF